MDFCTQKSNRIKIARMQFLSASRLWRNEAKSGTTEQPDKMHETFFLVLEPKEETVPQKN